MVKDAFSILEFFDHGLSAPAIVDPGLKLEGQEWNGRVRSDADSRDSALPFLEQRPQMPGMSATTQQIVNKAWNFAHVLREDLETALDQFRTVLEKLQDGSSQRPANPDA